ncbi:MAG: carbohydrate kinase family protein [Eubacteriales bacterium]|nr:carbohydrate kinase family protein [Eubacteriales bacterium]
MKKKVIAAGHICLDITPVFPEGKTDSLHQILSPGKLIQMGEADVHTGGAVANTGLAMKILGADVTLLGKIGKDAFGDMVLHILEQYDAQRDMVISGRDSTSYSVILAVPGIDRIFLHHPGANQSFLAEDVSDALLEEAALFHFGYPPIMRSMYEREGEELLCLLRKVRRAGVATSLDMAAVDASSEAGRADWEAILEKVLPEVDFFVPSVEELCYMLDRERFDEWQERAGGRDITEVLDIGNDVKPLAERCMDLGCKVLLIKCGAPGLYFRTAGRSRLLEISSRTELDPDLWADKEIFEKSYIPEKVRSGTGAGDTSIAAFLTAMLEGYDPERCLHLAAGTGASCVEAYDALSGLRSLEELERKIEGGWEKYK